MATAIRNEALGRLLSLPLPDEQTQGAKPAAEKAAMPPAKASN
jgi:hypothetical protein